MNKIFSIIDEYQINEEIIIESINKIGSRTSVIDEFMDSTKNRNQELVRKILGNYLFVGDKVFQEVATLSQGEQVRLILAELVNQKNNFLPVPSVWKVCTRSVRQS